MNEQEKQAQRQRDLDSYLRLKMDRVEGPAGFPEYKEGDEVWTYNTIRFLSGCAGKMLVRGATVISVRVELMS